MPNKSYKKIEVVGTSQDSVSEAIENAIDEARDSVDNLDWFEVTEIRGAIDDGSGQTYQVGVEIGFKLE